MERLLTQLAHTVAGAGNLEALTRPLLELLGAVTGLESAYFTEIDAARTRQWVRYAHNARDVMIPEGLSVPWEDTLCRRALAEGRRFTDCVPEIWGDSAAARELGIHTYVSQPVRDAGGALCGTLCAASRTRVRATEETLRLLGLFATLIGLQLERERAIEALRRANEELSAHALVDPLTGVSNRRALLQDLQRRLTRAERDGHRLAIAFIDLDGFKAINDVYGHEVGDGFLRHIAERLAAGVRAGDVVARYGGDEFVVVAAADGDVGDLRGRLEGLTIGPFTAGRCTIDYAGASVGVTESRPGETAIVALLERADAAMYAIKRQRKAVRTAR